MCCEVALCDHARPPVVHLVVGRAGAGLGPPDVILRGWFPHDALVPGRPAGLPHIPVARHSDQGAAVGDVGPVAILECLQGSLIVINEALVHRWPARANSS